MTGVVLALDQSTSGTKALLFDTAGGLLAKVNKPHQQHYPQPGWVEHDANEIYGNVVAVVRELLDAHPVNAEDILCLSITNQRETFVVFDKATGEPLHNAIVWQCRRGEPGCRELIDAGHEAAVSQVTGLKIDTYFPASKMTWLMDAKPEIAARLRDGSALLGTIETYLVYRLTKGAVFASDHTNACRTLLYDINTMCWSDDMCELFGVPRDALPEIRESAAQFGETDIDGVLPSSVADCRRHGGLPSGLVRAAVLPSRWRKGDVWYGVICAVKRR